MILTTSEAAEELGISPAGVRKMVESERLKPCVPGVKPLRFHLLDVADAQTARMSRGQRHRLDELALLLADESTICHDSA